MSSRDTYTQNYSKILQFFLKFFRKTKETIFERLELLCFFSFCKGKNKSLPKTGLRGSKRWLPKAHGEV